MYVATLACDRSMPILKAGPHGSTRSPKRLRQAHCTNQPARLFRQPCPSRAVRGRLFQVQCSQNPLPRDHDRRKEAIKQISVYGHDEAELIALVLPVTPTVTHFFNPTEPTGRGPFRHSNPRGIPSLFCLAKLKSLTMRVAVPRCQSCTCFSMRGSGSSHMTATKT
jgi:hypothetical protein